MKRFVDEFDIDEYSSRVLDMYFGNSTICSFDIETTGLFPRNDRVMLTGLLTVKNGRGTARQFFAESLSDEKAVLDATLSALKNTDVILTYNGRSFDVPFTETRAAHYGINAVMPYDLDLFTVVSGYSEIKKFTGSLSQKSIERFMGLTTSRNDRIDGRESIRLYEQYLAAPSYALEKTIMLHNHDDICQLYRILPIIRQTEFHKAMSRLGFPAGDFVITNIKITSDGLFVKAIKRHAPIDFISFPTQDAPYSIRMSSVTGETELDIPGEAVGEGGVVIDATRILRSLAKDSAASGAARDAASSADDNAASSVVSDGASGADMSEIDAVLEELKRYPSFASGYLILKNNNLINYMETNLFIKTFFEHLSL